MTITSDMFTTASVQVAFFAKTPGEFTQRKILLPLLNLPESPFDTEAAALPIPADAPVELPRVIVKSSDDVWKFTGGPARLDCYWTRSQESATTGIVQPLGQLRRILLAITEGSNLKIGRCALIVTRFAQVESPALSLIRHFCNSEVQQGALYRSDNFELHNHKKRTLPLDARQISVNSWMRCKTGALVADRNPVIVVEQDLNTLPEELTNRSFQRETLTKLLDGFAMELEETLSVYFPGGSTNA